MRRGFKGNILLIELLIVILFFSLSAAVTLRLYDRAHARSIKSQRLEEAILSLQDLAEQLYASDSMAEFLLGQGFARDGEQYTAEVNGFNISACLSEKATRAGVLESADLTALYGGEAVYALPVSRYEARGGAS